MGLVEKLQEESIGRSLGQVRSGKECLKGGRRLEIGFAVNYLVLRWLLPLRRTIMYFESDGNNAVTRALEMVINECFLQRMER